MASNFKVSVCREKDILHLKLKGDFDGASAFDLLNVLGKNCKGVERIFIHTSGLRNIYPFGRDMFHNNLHVLLDKHIRLVFIGVNSEKISPKRSKAF